MLKDKGLLTLFTLVSLVFGLALVLNGNDYWWLFWFSMLFFYGHLVNVLMHNDWENTVKKNAKTYPKDFVDDGYTDYVVHKNKLAKDKDNYCKKCRYLVCICKPVVN